MMILFYFILLEPGYPRDLLVDQLHVIGQDKRVLRVKWNSGLISDKDVTEAITGYTVYWCKGPYDMQQCRVSTSLFIICYNQK